MAVANYNSALGSSRYNLHAYVGRNDVHMTGSVGSVTFTRIYQRRPDDYRYAVASQWDVAKHSDRYLVWDLYAPKVKWPIGTLLTPPPMLMTDDLDAAIVATQMMYGQE